MSNPGIDIAGSLASENEKKKDNSMTSQETFQAAVKGALKLHGSNKWGQKHSEHVISECIGAELGSDGETIRQSEGFKLAAKTINPSAFAQWMEKNVKGFERDTKASRAESLVKGFELGE